MMGRALIRVLLLAAAFALATAAFGWWTVPLIAVVWGALARALRGASLIAAIAAAAAWGALLLWGAVHGPVRALAVELAGVMHVPAVALVAATLAFPAVLAWSGTAVMAHRGRSQRVGLD